MEFRLTYAGKLLAYRTDKRERKRTLHIHEIRREFHKQLKKFWELHPTLIEIADFHAKKGGDELQIFNQEGFRWLPMATERNRLICKLDILMLRGRAPEGALADIDNRLKTIFDALRMPDGADELGAGTDQGLVSPGPDEDPFYVLLQDDRLITHVAVTTDALLESVDDVLPENAARLVLNVTIRPYKVTMDNADYL